MPYGNVQMVKDLLKIEREGRFKEFKYDFVECGCCGQYHRPGYEGDCRNDEERFGLEDVPEDAEIYTIEEQMEEE